MRLDVRAKQTRAIALYESYGYERWGTLDRYHKVNGEMVAGHFYVKNLG
jgi:RimJ/RimL family protein N-acetyltransferase